jgi:glycosyltransferase involved in cell wall biosynthesis
VILEAMAAGIPTVGTDVGGVAQQIADDLLTTDGRTIGPCGETVTPGDVVQMADGIQAVIGNIDAYANYAANARTRVQELFQMHEVMSSYNQIYRALGDLPVIDEMVELLNKELAPVEL